MHPWEREYANGFAVTTDQPSGVVRLFEKQLPRHARVTDFGCGQGRNSRFLAKQGHDVEAIDVADVFEWSGIADAERARIRHVIGSVLSDDGMRPLDGVVAARLIQYLSHRELERLTDIISGRCRLQALCALSNTESGGMSGGGYLDAAFHAHSLDEVVGRFSDRGWAVMHHVAGDRSRHVPLSLPAVTHDLLLKKG